MNREKPAWLENAERFIYNWVLFFTVFGCVVWNIWGFNKLTAKFNEIKYRTTMENLGIVSVYRYTNIKSMTDNNPDTMSSGEKVYNGAIAVSRDLLDYVQFGDVVFLIIDGKKEPFIVEDVMNSKHRRSVDVYIPVENTKSITKKEWQVLNTKSKSRMWVAINNCN